jgi:hypothetical protein
MGTNLSAQQNKKPKKQFKMAKLLKQVIAIILLICLSSCEKDLYENAFEQKDVSKIKKIKMSDPILQSNLELIKSVNHIRDKKEKSNSRMIYDSINDFYFDDENGVSIEKGNYKSFTFPVIRKINDGNMENILFTLNSKGKYDTYLVKYPFSENKFKNISKAEIHNKKVKFTPIENNFSYRIGVMCTETWTLVETGCECPGGNYSATWVLSATDCTSTGGGDDNLDYSSVSTVPVTNTSNTSLEVLGITREQYNWVKVQNTTLKAIIGTYTAEPEEGPSMSDVINYLIANPDVNKNLTDYLDQNNTPEAKAFAIETVNYFIANLVNSDSETNELFFKALRATNNFQNDLTESFVQDNISYFSQDVQNQILIDPLLAVQIAQEYLIQRAVKKYLHPNWNEVQIYYSVLWDLRHMTLDAFGLIPVFGEVADLANGTLYTLEGDKVNAAFSFASAVPVYGWAAVGVKYAVKIKTVATIGTKVKLTWKVLVDGTIYFGSDNTCRAQLRKVLGLAVGNLNQAHHIIPLNKQTKSIVQKASKSGSAFHMNEALNGIPLSTAVHSGSHFNYDAVIQSKFDLFNTDYPNATPDQCYTFLTSLTQQVRNWIATHPNTPINNIVLP